ncbi:MAG: hypothetical protein ACRYFR_05175 [Janthinobacterium lividum]
MVKLANVKILKQLIFSASWLFIALFTQLAQRCQQTNPARQRAPASPPGWAHNYPKARIKNRKMAPPLATAAPAARPAGPRQ